MGYLSPVLPPLLAPAPGLPRTPAIQEVWMAVPLAPAGCVPQGRPRLGRGSVMGGMWRARLQGAGGGGGGHHPRDMAGLAWW